MEQRLPQRVAQIFNLPYRRLAVSNAINRATARNLFSAQQIKNLRYGRLKICATSLT
jgi:hypothetical protein